MMVRKVVFFLVCFIDSYLPYAMKYPRPLTTFWFAAALLCVSSMMAVAQEQPATLAERLGYASDAKLLIVHTDDIGVAHSVNRASIDALETGLVNSGSIMVPCPWFPEIAAYVREHPEVDLGLHLTLTSEWKHYRWQGVLPRPQSSSLLNEQGFQYESVEQVVANADPAEVEQEIRAQVERAIAFGIQPTHLDSHMGSLFTTPEIFEAYLRVGRDFNIPVMLPKEALEVQAPHLMALVQPEDIMIDRIVMVSPAVAEDEWDAYYTEVVENLQPGVTEIIIHVGYDDAELQAVMVDHPDYGSAWRQRDFDFFTSDTFRSLLKEHDIQLITWREIGKLME